jgi:hypothetical protein
LQWSANARTRTYRNQLIDISGMTLYTQNRFHGRDRLLRVLPAWVPVDLWINNLFENLDMFVTERSRVEERLDCPSTNAYCFAPLIP